MHTNIRTFQEPGPVLKHHWNEESSVRAHTQNLGRQTIPLTTKAIISVRILQKAGFGNREKFRVALTYAQPHINRYLYVDSESYMYTYTAT